MVAHAASRKVATDGSTLALRAARSSARARTPRRAERDRFPAQRTLFALNVPPRADARRRAAGGVWPPGRRRVGRGTRPARWPTPPPPTTPSRGRHVVFARAAALKEALRAARPVQLALAEELPAAAAAAGGDGSEDREALQRSVDAFMRSFEADEGRRRRELEASHNRMDGDGFTLVTRQQKGTGAERGRRRDRGRRLARRGGGGGRRGRRRRADGGGGARAEEEEDLRRPRARRLLALPAARAEALAAVRARAGSSGGRSKIAKMREARAFQAG